MSVINEINAESLILDFIDERLICGDLNTESTKIVKESELKRGTSEYKISLVLDNLLNIERRRIK